MSEPMWVAYGKLSLELERPWRYSLEVTGPDGSVASCLLSLADMRTLMEHVQDLVGEADAGIC